MQTIVGYAYDCIGLYCYRVKGFVTSMVISPASNTVMDRFAKGRDRGGDYILKHMRPDGTVENSHNEVWRYWGIPIALTVSGHSAAAGRFFNWIRNNVFTEEGDFGSSPERKQMGSYAYQNAWLIEGAQRLGQFDLSQRGMDFITSFWDPVTGGFYSSYHDRDDETDMEIYVTSGCGRAAIYTNRLDVARGVGGFLNTVMKGQPNYPDQLYAVYKRKDGLQTNPETDDMMRFVMSQDSTQDQQFFNPGIAGGFLVRLYQITGENQWLDLAKEYMYFAEIASDHFIKLPGLRQGKSAWGAAVLYTITGEDKYRELATRIGDSILSYQAAEGYWYGLSPDKHPSLGLTAEMVIWLDEINQSVGHV